MLSLTSFILHNMGCCSSSNDDRVIDYWLAKYEHPRTNRSITLCGTRCAGKSTIFNQIRFSRCEQNQVLNTNRLQRLLVQSQCSLFTYVMVSLLQLCKIVIQTHDSHFYEFKQRLTQHTNNCNDDDKDTIYQAY